MRFNIESTELEVDIEATAKFYLKQPEIKENCQCADCRYFQDKVIRQPINLFEVLRAMGADLSRQPNINPDGICCVDDCIGYQKKYMGYYMVVGEILEFKEPAYTDAESNSITSWEIKQKDEFLVFDFYIQYNKI